MGLLSNHQRFVFGEKILEIEGRMHRHVVMKCHFSTRGPEVSAALLLVNTVKQVYFSIQSFNFSDKYKTWL